MKGMWIPSLLARVLDGSLTYAEMIGFILWRIRRTKPPLRIEGLLFKDVDRVMWGLILNIFIKREYTSRGFNIGPNDIVIDIGAHRGVFAGFASNRTRNAVVAIEPDPENSEQLERFILDNKIDNIELKKMAVDLNSGETTLYKAQSSSRHTITGIDQVSGKQLAETVRVKAIALSDLFSTFETIDFLKMDCEGAEIYILVNSEDETLRKVKCLVAEVHWIGRVNSPDLLRKRLERIYNNIVLVKTSSHMGLLYAS